MNDSIIPRIIVHGGTGRIDDPVRRRAYSEGLKEALLKGREVLTYNGSALDAVIAAVVNLENNHLFNAGHGSVFCHDESHELDASVMDGATKKCGGGIGLRTVKNPILLARKVMEESSHVLLAGNGAENFATKVGVQRVENNYFSTPYRYQQLQEAIAATATRLDHSSELNNEKKHGTVGAVARDSKGNLAAATSTGGITNKLYGRVGDSPIIGAGTYANNATCAISCTGYGEEFIRHSVAASVHTMMAYGDMTLKEAVEEVVFKVLPEGTGGLISIDNKGDIVYRYNSHTMLYAYVDEFGEIQTHM